MCGCGGTTRATRTVYRVVYPDGTRSPDYAIEADARRDNVRRGGTGTVTTAQVPG